MERLLSRGWHGRPFHSRSALWGPPAVATLTDEEFADALEKVRVTMAAYRERSGLGMDRIAKTGDLVQELLDEHFPLEQEAAAPPAG
jgi:hypothetical protein